MTMMTSDRARWGLTILLACGLMLCAAGCKLLPDAEPVAVQLYTLDYPVTPREAAPSGPAIRVSRIRTGSGLSSQRMLYRGGVHRVGYLVRSQWAMPPGEMLAPLVVAVLEVTGHFEAVLPSGASGFADVRLDLELLDLSQDFTTEPASVHLKLRAQLLDITQQRVLATRTFAHTGPVTRDETVAAVEAMNQLLGVFLPELAQFCVESSRGAQKRSD
jgi:cholesterol transport system auxiliary component